MLHPALQALAQAAREQGAPRIDQMTVAEARGLSQAYASHLSGTGPAMARVEDVEIPVRHGAIGGRLFVPEGPATALVLFFHGGGWVLGDLESYDPVGRLVAEEMACAVLLVDYRLAPEHPFPAGLEDCIDAISWAPGALGELGLAGDLPLAIMGDSGGGNLAAAAAQQLRGRDVAIAAQVLIVPNLDAEPDTESFAEVWDSALFGGRSMEWFWSKYHADPAGRLQPAISPLRASDLGGLPPAIVVTAEHDPFRDEGRAYAEAMRAAGVRVQHIYLDTLSHGFLNMAAVFDAPARVVRQIGHDLVDMMAGKSVQDRSYSSLAA